MNEEEYVAWVWERLPLIPDKNDCTCADRMIRQDFRQGITKEDCLKVTKLTEHVSPNLSERYACDRIAEIYAKYPNYAPKGKS